jgi:hypothetical protein
MPAPTSPPRPPADPPPTGGAWLGLGIAARGAVGVLFSAAPMITVAFLSGITSFVDEEMRRRGGGAVVPEATRLLDILSELGEAMRPMARFAGVTGVAIGIGLFVAGAALMRGSDTGRRAARVLLVFEAVQSVAAAVWSSILWCTRLADWYDRYQKAIADLAANQSGGRAAPMVQFHFPPMMNIASQAIGTFMSLAILGVLFWLAGRPFAREWCALRSGRYPVARAAAAG